MTLEVSQPLRALSAEARWLRMEQLSRFSFFEHDLFGKPVTARYPSAGQAFFRIMLSRPTYRRQVSPKRSAHRSNFTGGIVAQRSLGLDCSRASRALATTTSSI